MKRVFACSGLLVAAALAIVPVLRADVTTKEKTTFKMEGMMGAMVNRAMGGNDGITSTVAVKGNRMARISEKSGQIIDLTEEKVYTLDIGKKEYTVMTFAEFRQMMEQAKQRAQEQAAKTSPQDKQAAQDAGKQLEFDVDVKETGQTKSLIGHNAREVVLTITMREKGKKVEESGGMILTNTMWIAPKIAALDELGEFMVKYAKAINLGGLVDPQQAGAFAMMPGIGQMAEKLAAEGRKLQGTTLSTTSVFESVKNAEQLKQAEAQGGGGGGGGIGGMLAGKLMKKGPVEARSKVLTTTHETLSIAPTANAADLAIPANFKEKKK